MKISPEVLAALRNRAQTDGARLVLTGPRMTEKLYGQVNDVLEAVGGRWDRHAQAHLFPCNAADALAPALTTGTVVTLREKRTQAQYFPTPPTVVQRLLDLAELRPGMEMLEPSAGSGAIAAAAVGRGAVVDCIEQDPGYTAVLIEKTAPRSVQVSDFLTVEQDPRYDRVVMNPPFTRQADIAHVRHALGFLKPDGLLAAVMSHSVTFQRGEGAEFRVLVEERGGTVEALPEGAFAESGTGVRTILVTIPATARAGAEPVVWPTAVEQQLAPADVKFEDPAAIAREIADNLREAMAIMEQLAQDLAARTHVTATVVDLPQPEVPAEQLTFDLPQPDDGSAEAA